MSEKKKQSPEFQEDPPRRSITSEFDDVDALLLDIDGYEGPIDVLLSLARDQKVDLTKISILALAKQYLAFIDQAKQIKLELAADYLVMASWLAFLKSKLLLPQQEDEEGELSGPEMAEALAFQLRRLEAMREVSEKLMDSTALGAITLFTSTTLKLFCPGMAKVLFPLKSLFMGFPFHAISISESSTLR